MRCVDKLINNKTQNVLRPKVRIITKKVENPWVKMIVSNTYEGSDRSHFLCPFYTNNEFLANCLPPKPLICK